MFAIFTRIFKLSSLKSESSKLRKQLQDKDRQLEHVIQELSELRNIREVGYWGFRRRPATDTVFAARAAVYK